MATKKEVDDHKTETFLFTSESVGEGHPGEFVDQWLLARFISSIICFNIL